MASFAHQDEIPLHPEKRPWRVGGVSYRNALPLLDGLSHPHLKIIREVPSVLGDMLQEGQLDLALAPIYDWLAAPADQPLQLIPAGCIASDAATESVMLWTNRPLDQVRTVHADMDSHTSVQLLGVLYQRIFGFRPKIIPWQATQPLPADAQATLQIGDKVMTRPPRTQTWPHQMDLGKAWFELTGLPFVFAAWLARHGDAPYQAALAQLQPFLHHRLTHNLARLPALAVTHASTDWPTDKLEIYWGHTLNYCWNDQKLTTVQLFAQWLYEDGILSTPATLNRRPLTGQAYV